MADWRASIGDKSEIAGANRAARLARPDPADAGAAAARRSPSHPSHLPCPDGRQIFRRQRQRTGASQLSAARERRRRLQPQRFYRARDRGRNPIRRGEVKRGGRRARGNKLGRPRRDGDARGHRVSTSLARVEEPRAPPTGAAQIRSRGVGKAWLRIASPQQPLQAAE